MILKLAELAEILREGEGARVEFKRGLPRPEKVARSLCSFANTRGGLFLVGVDDDGSVRGASDPRAATAEIRRVARELVLPPVEVRTQTLATEAGRVVVVCSVPLSRLRPHAALGADGADEIVVRVGSSNRVARGAALEALRFQRRGRSSLDELEQRILAWVGREAGGERRARGVTIEGFLRSHNIGKQRARRAFLHLEREGHLVGHGVGARRAYGLP